MKQLNKEELKKINGGGLFDDLIDALEDWLLCNLKNGDNCPDKDS